jgi:hypothetical protein
MGFLIYNIKSRDKGEGGVRVVVKTNIVPLPVEIPRIWTSHRPESEARLFRYLTVTFSGFNLRFDV